MSDQNAKDPGPTKDQLDVKVVWNSPARTVTVRFDVQPAIAYLIPVPPSENPTVSPLDTKDEESVLDFLRAVTRTAPDGGVVHANLIEAAEPKFLKLLGVKGPGPIVKQV